MSGVNCTRRNSTPTARANAFASSVFGDAGNAFEQQMTADARRRDHDVDDVILADDDLAHLAHDPVSQFVHAQGPLVGRQRGDDPPEREHVVGRRTGGRHSVAISSSASPSCRAAASTAFRDPRRPASPACCLIRSRHQVAERRERAAAASEVRSSVSAIASTYTGACRRQVRGRPIGRTEATAPRPREQRSRRRRATNERDLPAVRERAEPAPLAVSVHPFGEHDGRVRRPAPRARDRTRRCRPRRSRVVLDR